MDNIQEAEDIISDTITCLGSYKTALRIRASGIKLSEDVSHPQSTAAIAASDVHGKHLFADSDFKPEALERSESGLFNMWRNWEMESKTKIDIPSDIGSTEPVLPITDAEGTTTNVEKGQISTASTKADVLPKEDDSKARLKDASE